MLTGAGSSAFVGDILAPALSRQLGRRVDAVPTTDIVSNPREAFAEDVPTVLVSFARSGDSPESMAAPQLAEQYLSEVHHVIVTCSDQGRLFRSHAGRRALAGATHAAARQRPGLRDDLKFHLYDAGRLAHLRTGTPSPARIDAIVATRGSRSSQESFQTAAALAAREYHRVVYIGSGALTGLAHESALKLLELTAGRTVTYFDSALGFRHGPKSVLDERTLAVVYLSNDPYTRLYDEDIAAELVEALGPGQRATGRRPAQCPARRVRRPGPRPGRRRRTSLLSLPFVVYAQTLGLQFALALGSTPDNPFPSGEVNRVVQGVTIHPADR